MKSHSRNFLVILTAVAMVVRLTSVVHAQSSKILEAEVLAKRIPVGLSAKNVSMTVRVEPRPDAVDYAKNVAANARIDYVAAASIFHFKIWDSATFHSALTLTAKEPQTELPKSYGGMRKETICIRGNAISNSDDLNRDSPPAFFRSVHPPSSVADFVQVELFPLFGRCHYKERECSLFGTEVKYVLNGEEYETNIDCAGGIKIHIQFRLIGGEIDLASLRMRLTNTDDEQELMFSGFVAAANGRINQYVVKKGTQGSFLIKLSDLVEVHEEAPVAPKLEYTRQPRSPFLVMDNGNDQIYSWAALSNNFELLNVQLPPRK